MSGLELEQALLAPWIWYDRTPMLFISQIKALNAKPIRFLAAVCLAPGSRMRTNIIGNRNRPMTNPPRPKTEKLSPVANSRHA